MEKLTLKAGDRSLDIFPDVALRLFYRPGSPRNCIIHVRAIVDGKQVVWRRWSRKWGGYWDYGVSPAFLLEEDLIGGYLSEVKKS